jgi:hypothetical protein
MAGAGRLSGTIELTSHWSVDFTGSRIRGTTATVAIGLLHSSRITPHRSVDFTGIARQLSNWAVVLLSGLHPGAFAFVLGLRSVLLPVDFTGSTAM